MWHEYRREGINMIWTWAINGRHYGKVVTVYDNTVSVTRTSLNTSSLPYIRLYSDETSMLLQSKSCMMSTYRGTSVSFHAFFSFASNSASVSYRSTALHYETKKTSWLGLAWLRGTVVEHRLPFPVPRSTFSLWVTTYVGKPSAIRSAN